MTKKIRQCSGGQPSSEKNPLKECVISNVKAFFITGIIVFTVTVIARTTYLNSQNIKYKKGNQNASLNESIDELYSKAEECGKIIGCPGCTKLEYLESTGTQYIDTGIVPNSTTKVISQLSMKTGYNGWGSSGGQESFLWGISSNKYASSVASNWNIILTNVETDYQKHTFDLENGSQKFDGIQYGTTTIGDTAVSGQTLYLFASHVEWTNASYWSNEKIYYTKIYNGNTLVRDYIPVLDINDRPCLFDKVSKTCFYNQGTGEFLYG